MNKLIKKDWIPATATHNYFNDPLLDWFKYNYPLKNKNSSYHKVKNNMMKSFLCKQGNEFEKEIIKLIYNKVGKKNIIKIDSIDKARDDQKVKETLNAMKKGYTIILGGVLHNNKNKSYGLPDILIRSDKINDLILHDVIDDDKSINANLLGKQKWHYRVIDIKYQTLNLKADGETLLNSGMIPAYKSQLCVYNQALGVMQGYQPGQAYLLGRRWVYQKQGRQYYNNSCFDKLGIIDYEQDDEHYIQLTQKALDWVKLCKTDKAKKWNVFQYPLKYEELYPNMSNQKNDQWNNLKNKIARQNYELTSLWQVGKKHRHQGLQNGINNWMDKKCTAKKLGIHGKTGETLDKIIKINQTKKQLIAPTEIKSDLNNWKNPKNIEFFVDFEYKNAVFDQVIKLPIVDTAVLLFTIGVGYIDPTNQTWQFKNFTVNQLNDDEEYTICKNFLNYIYKKAKQFHVKNPQCWHWSFAEPNVFNNILLKHQKINHLWRRMPLVWCDLLSLFHSEPIVIHGALNFKLKSIAQAMYKNGFIKTIWDHEMTDGQTAMVETVQSGYVNDIVVKYNEIDVKVLQEILAYLRSMQHHHKKRAYDGPSMHTRSVKRKLL